MKRGKWTTLLTTGAALAALLASSASAIAQTAPKTPPDTQAPMAKPTNDHMSHEPPASGANAK